jgi:hypothetical protein
MASQARKYRGFATERVVAEYLRQFWEFASVGRGKGKDIQSVPFDVEVKARTGFQPKQVLAQIKARTSKTGELGFAVLRLNGQGEDAREYAAIIRFEDLVNLLVKAGYTNMPPNVRELDPIRCNKCGDWMFEGMTCRTCKGLSSNADI